MGRGSMLSIEEQAQIKALRDAGLSIRQISTQLGRSKNVISKFLRSPDLYHSRKSSGRPRLLSTRDERQIVRMVSNKSISLEEVRKSLSKKVSKETIRCCLKRNGNVVYTQLRSAPRLTETHKRNRLEFVSRNKRRLWTKVIFSDEKRFNLDGPDGNRFYWHDLRKEKEYFPRRNFGGGTVMVWAAFHAEGKLPLAFTSARMDADEYQQLLETHLLPFLQQNAGQGWVFQQDNAPPHASRSTKGFLRRNSVEVLDWPACSPDMNPMENIWGHLVRKIYEHNQTYSSLQGLRSAILRAWDELPLQTLRNHAASMPARLVDVAMNRGGPIEY